MKVLIVTPAAARSLSGNRVTAERWGAMLRRLGADVRIADSFKDQPCDALIALHARKSAASIRRFRRDSAGGPLIVALTGTDLYVDLPKSAAARQSLELADFLIALQPDAINHLPTHLRDKVRVILQSAVPPPYRPRPLRSVFEVTVLGHLRTVKDPFRAALASRRLPASSRVRVVQVGEALSEAMRRRCQRETGSNRRYRWVGGLPRQRALTLLARGRLTVVSSKLEGGANVIAEALVAGVPVLASRVSGNFGMLGPEYPGYFEFGNTGELSELMSRAETDPAFYARLKRECRRLAVKFEPRRELATWRRFLDEIARQTR
jgi:putative glycosyltransferase (TIGR04348 family)